MLAALAYHRIGTGKYTNALELMKEHLVFEENYAIVLPGDPLDRGKLSLCLTFDDATFDFYHYVFPLLKELNLRALIAVPVHYIVERTNLPPKERLSVPYTLAMQDGFYDQKVPFCTWEEINEMVRSGLISVACHSYLHCNLTFDFVDLKREVVTSKKILEEKIGQKINTFIYPFGQCSERVHEFVRGHYPFSFRIGSALNWGWGEGKNPLCRIPADNLRSATDPLNFFKLTNTS